MPPITYSSIWNAYTPVSPFTCSNASNTSWQILEQVTGGIRTNKRCFVAMFFLICPSVLAVRDGSGLQGNE